MEIKHKDKYFRLTVEEVQKRVFEAHGDVVKLKVSSYIDSKHKAIFIDAKYGEFNCLPSHVWWGHGHPKRGIEKYSNSNKISLETVKEKIVLNHSYPMSIVEDTYNGTSKKATFFDLEYGFWEATVNSVMDGGGHPERGKNESAQNRRLTEKEINDKLITVHNGMVALVPGTYTVAKNKAKFMHLEYGEWEAIALNVITGTSHPLEGMRNRKTTCLEKYGVENPSQNADLALKAALKTNTRFLRHHWKTKKELVCQGSWESKVVDYLNNNEIDFLWQPKVFKMPNGKTYRPDLFLVGENKWIEIKGWMRPESKPKWDWFLTQFPDAELWNQKKLKEMGIL